MSDREALDPLIFGSEQRCFGCGPQNRHGMGLRFYREGDEVVTELCAADRDGWEGPPGVLHGGLQATLADEIGAWTLVGIRGQFGLTTTMNLRYLRPARIDQPIEARGRISEQTDEAATVRVTLRQGGRRLLTGSISYVIPTVEIAERVMGSELPDAWRMLARRSL